MIPTKQQWGNWSLPSKLTAVGTFLGVIGVVLSVLFFLLSMDDNAGNTSEVKAVLNSAIYENQTILSQLQSIKIMHKASKGTPDANITSMGRFHYDLTSLNKLKNNGGLAKNISPQFHQQISRFINQINSFLEVLNPESPDLDQPGTYWLFEIELQKQLTILKSEVDYLDKKISDEERKIIFTNAMNKMAMEILSRAQ
jgi:hypothetical protein